MVSSEKDKEQEENKNEITVTFNKKHLIIAILLVTLSPVGVALGITWPKQLFGHTSADANSWLQFWGSMLGGIIGTAAVLIVAAWQNKEQRRLLDIQISTQKRLNDEFIEIEKAKELKADLKIFYDKLNSFLDLYFEYRKLNEKLFSEVIFKDVIAIKVDYDEIKKNIENYYNIFYDEHSKIEAFNKILCKELDFIVEFPPTKILVELHNTEAEFYKNEKNLYMLDEYLEYSDDLIAHIEEVRNKIITVFN